MRDRGLLSFNETERIRARFDGMAKCVLGRGCEFLRALRGWLSSRVSCCVPLQCVATVGLVSVEGVCRVFMMFSR